MAQKKKKTVKSAAKKKAIAKVVKKQAAKKAASRPIKAEIVVRVDTTPQVPTETALAEPMTTDGTKALTVRKSWISENQLHRMLQRTPKENVYRRKGKGNQEFDYVTGSYCIKWLNYIFAWDWDFEVTEHGQAGDHVWALGKLTVRGEKPGQVIVKTAFGRSEVKFLTEGQGANRKKTDKYVDYGNDLKAASTDAMKKAASLLGFASDIYGKSDYKAETGKAPLPAPRPPQEQIHPTEGAVIDYSQPQFTCMEVMGNGKVHGVSISQEQAQTSLKRTGAELCKAHESARIK